MQTILILLYPDRLENPDLDLRYEVPDRIEEATQGVVQDNGYDYIGEGYAPALGIWLKADDAQQSWQAVKELMEQECFLDNDLSRSAEIYISEKDAAPLEECRRVFPA